jgi:hypothetical protein
MTATERQQRRRTRLQGEGLRKLEEWVPAECMEEARRLLGLLRSGQAIPSAETVAALEQQLAAQRQRAETAEAEAAALRSAQGPARDQPGRLARLLLRKTPAS